MNLSENTSIPCSEAIELIDSRDALTQLQTTALKHHLVDCVECRTAKRIEPALRSILAPRRMPRPSVSFEARLIQELDLTPRHSVVSGEAPLARWSWAISVLTLGLLAAVQVPKIIPATIDVPALPKLIFAWLVSHLNGDIAVALNLLSPQYFARHAMSFSILLGSVLVAGSVWAVNRINDYRENI